MWNRHVNDNCLLTERLFSDPDVDHDPLHDSSNAEEDREKPVCPQATFTRDKVEQIF